jgi:hypothetical protein
VVGLVLIKLKIIIQNIKLIIKTKVSEVLLINEQILNNRRDWTWSI